MKGQLEEISKVKEEPAVARELSRLNEQLICLSGAIYKLGDCLKPVMNNPIESFPETSILKESYECPLANELATITSRINKIAGIVTSCIKNLEI